MDNRVFNPAFFSQPQPALLNALCEEADEPILPSNRQEEISSIKLLFSFILYLAGALGMDYGWHHHTFSFFLVGGFVVLSGLTFLLSSFVSGKGSVARNARGEREKEDKSCLNDASFIPMKM